MPALLPLTVAAAQPPCAVRDVAANVRAHAAVLHEAGARVVVFPELSLTGYALDADAVATDDPALDPLVAACADAGAVALAGAPVRGPDGARHLAVLRVDGDGARVAYRKTWLGGDEPAHFSPGDGPAVTEVDGWRLGLAVCKDTGSMQHVAGLAALGVDAVVAGVVHHPAELAEQEARAVVLARACRAPVVLASAAGPVGGGYDRTTGGSSVRSADGVALALAGDAPGDLAGAVLDPAGG